MNTKQFCTGLLRTNKALFPLREKSQSSAEYCINNVKQYDYENFVCTLLLKNTSRSCALAIRSFNVEVARVAEQVSQENIGLMRMKFWEETLDKCYTKDPKLIPKHPVAIELYKALSKSQMTKRYFNNLIEIRKQHFSMLGFKNLEEMEKYAEQSVSNVYYLILEGCGVKNLQADHAASHLGKAQGIVQQLRATPFTKKINFLPLPRDILIKNKINQEQITRGISSESLNDCIFELATRAHQHLMKARNLSDKVPSEAKAAFLPAIPVYNYLDKLQLVNYDIFHPSLQTRTWKLLPQLWLSNFRNKY